MRGTVIPTWLPGVRMDAFWMLHTFWCFSVMSSYVRANNEKDYLVTPQARDRDIHLPLTHTEWPMQSRPLCCSRYQIHCHELLAEWQLQYLSTWFLILFIDFCGIVFQVNKFRIGDLGTCPKHLYLEFVPTVNCGVCFWVNMGGMGSCKASNNARLPSSHHMLLVVAGCVCVVMWIL